MSIYNCMGSMIEAADSGDLEAQHNVGACYATGDWDGPKDEAEAINWYTRAANLGIDCHNTTLDIC
jgi:TPR repeat protein